jgi:ubiquinone/menaquinone biosynthesis C-methylase UbiE
MVQFDTLRIGKQVYAMSQYIKSAEVYDAIYTAKKDYAYEGKQYHAIIEAHARTDGKELLDVACGTGLHTEVLQQWYNVTGLDISENQLAFARKRLPKVRLYIADMTNFNTGKTYDVITCLFSAIGELLDIKQVDAAIETMAQHLNTGGVLLVEAWLRPEQFNPSRIWSDFVDTPDVKVARMTTAVRRGKIVNLTMHHMVGTLKKVEEFIEVHQEAMHSVDEYMQAFKKAGLTVTHDPQGVIGRSLYVAIKT